MIDDRQIQKLKGAIVIATGELNFWEENTAKSEEKRNLYCDRFGKILSTLENAVNVYESFVQIKNQHLKNAESLKSIKNLQKTPGDDYDKWVDENNANTLMEMMKIIDTNTTE